MKKNTGTVECRPLKTKLLSIKSEENELQYAVPGGLIAIGSRLDPTLTIGDQLSGNVVGIDGRMPPILDSIEVKYFLLKDLLGVRSSEGQASRVKKLMGNEILMLNIGSTAVGGTIVGVKDHSGFERAKILLMTPVCCAIGSRAALSRKIDKHWRLIGWGTILKGNKIVS